MEVQILTRSQSRQQIGQILGISNFLRQRSALLQLKISHGLGGPKEARELQLIEKALMPVSKEGRNIPNQDSLHLNEAGNRFRQMFKRGASLTHADLVQMHAMAEFSYAEFGRETAERLAYISCMEMLGLATDEELSELLVYRRAPAAANY